MINKLLWHSLREMLESIYHSGTVSLAKKSSYRCKVPKIQHQTDGWEAHYVSEQKVKPYTRSQERQFTCNQVTIKKKVFLEDINLKLTNWTLLSAMN